MDDDLLLLALSRDVHYLNDEMAVAERKQALTRISHALQVPLAAVTTSSYPPSSSSTPLQLSTLATATALLTKPLLRRLTDSSEQCRLLACTVLCELVARSPLSALTGALAYIVPSVAFRLNCRDLTSACQPYSAAVSRTHYPPSTAASTAEPSEEVRLQLLQLTAAVVQRLNTLDSQTNELDLVLADIVTVIAQCVTDRSPELLQAATSLLLELLTRDRHQLRSTSILLARLLTPNLAHKHSRVRVLTLQAMQRLLVLGAAEHIRELAAFTEHNVIDMHAFYHGDTRRNYFALLCADGNERVREALYALVGHCMTIMAEAADYETLLMPYLLTGLADRCQSSRHLCRSYVDTLAAQYHTQHADELDEAERYVSRPTEPEVQLSNFPYCNRPSRQLQLRLRVFVDRLFPALLAELSDWKAEVRSESVRLLRTLLWLAEENVGAEWRAETLSTAVRVRDRDEQSEERRRRDERGDWDDNEVEAVWSEAMRLLATFGGDELMRTLRTQREEGHERGVLSLLPAILYGMDAERTVLLADDVEGWLEADRRAGGMDQALLRRQLRVYAALEAVLPAASLAGVVTGLQELVAAAQLGGSTEQSRALAVLSAAQKRAAQK